MSAEKRTKIGTWVMFVLGLFLMGKQVYSYVFHTFTYTTDEITVFVIGLVMVFAPRVLGEAAVRVVKNYSKPKTNPDDTN